MRRRRRPHLVRRGLSPLGQGMLDPGAAVEREPERGEGGPLLPASSRSASWSVARSRCRSASAVNASAAERGSSWPRSTDRRSASLRPPGSRVARREPLAQVGGAVVADPVHAPPARPGIARHLDDRARLDHARELGVDLARVRRPDVAEPAVHPLGEVVPAHRLGRQQPQDRVPQCHAGNATRPGPGIRLSGSRGGESADVEST